MVKTDLKEQSVFITPKPFEQISKEKANCPEGASATAMP